MEGTTKLVFDIKPRLNVLDYYGNLPIHYTIRRDDLSMVTNYYSKRDSSEYFEVRNYKYETIFHVAAKYNSY